MSNPPFNRFWGDPAEHMDEWRSLRRLVEAAEKEQRERELKRKRRKIRKLTKLAMERKLKGQK
jgi:hypothetical protein